jgi:adenine-specific DNA-methyltransferase
MPTLDWIGKKAVLNHHREVPYRLLKCDSKLSVGDPGSGNLLVEGDNLEALKALLPYYGGQVKCIYIDPPYNTGVDERDEEGKRIGWIFSDNVGSPEIRQWLGKVVGAEADDLSRHDKWLCMMYPRLFLLRDFLKEDGVIFASIDEVEVASLRLLLDEIFGTSNRVGTIIWKNVTDNNPTNIAVEHEYVLCYAKSRERLPPEWKSKNLAVKDKLLSIGSEFVKKYSDTQERQSQYTKWFRENKAFLWPFDRYKFIDDDGIYTGSQSVHNPGKEGYRYDVIHPRTKKPCAQPLMGYRFPKETLDDLLALDRVLFGDDESKIIELKLYVKDYRAKLASLFELDGRIGTNEIKEIFPDNKRPFDFPKPTELVEELVSFTTSNDDLILDSFAGSGTTGHAVLKLNRNDQQQRKFILVEMKSSIARPITSERLRRVSLGYKNGKGELVEGLGGGFRFCSLGDAMFDANGNVCKTVTFGDLARHVFFSETGEPLPKAANGKRSPLIGTCNNTAYYLLFNGILGDKSSGGGSVLTGELLAHLPPHDGPRVVFGEGCRLGAARLKREGVTFKQIPYEVKVS